MTIASGILQLLVLVLPTILAAWAQHQTPTARLEALNEASDKAIADRNVDAITAVINAELQNQAGGNISGSASPV